MLHSHRNGSPGGGKWSVLVSGSNREIWYLDQTERSGRHCQVNRSCRLTASQMKLAFNSCRRLRVPAGVVSHMMRPNHVICLGLRDAGMILSEHGVIVKRNARLNAPLRPLI